MFCDEGISETSMKKRAGMLSMLECHTSRNNPDNCDNHSIHEPLLERATLYVIKQLTETQEMQASILAYMEKSLETINSHEPLKLLREKNIDIANELKRHVRSKIRSGMSDEKYDEIYSQLEQDLNQCETDIENLKNDVNRELLMRRRFYALKNFIDLNYEDLHIIKSFFGMLLVMGKNYVRYVIDDTFSIIDDLHQQMDAIKKYKPIVKGVYIDTLSKQNFYYEVVKHEKR